MKTQQEIIHAFTPIEPKFLTETQKIMINKLVVEFHELATLIGKDVPECADRTDALRKLLECKMMCNQAITHTGYGKPEYKEKTDDKNNTQNKKAG